MKAAYELYPKGSLKGVVVGKRGRSVEIILCPYIYDGIIRYGIHIYDKSGDAKRQWF